MYPPPTPTAAAGEMKNEMNILLTRLNPRRHELRGAADPNGVDFHRPFIVSFRGSNDAVLDMLWLNIQTYKNAAEPTLNKQSSIHKRQLASKHNTSTHYLTNVGPAS